MKIAIDGPAASGKGTLARQLAAHYGLAYLDTGSLYRAVGAMILAEGGDPDDEATALVAAKHIDPQKTGQLDIRSREAGVAASIVAAKPQVREELLRYQRRFARQGAVLDGRDIGTVVLPDADAKLFVVANLQTRAKRRAAELRAKGIKVSDEDMATELKLRDDRDSGRQASPLMQAQDADLLDTSDLGIETAFRHALALIEHRLRKNARA